MNSCGELAMKPKYPKGLALLFLLLAAIIPGLSQTKADEAWQIIRANANEKETSKRVQAVRVLSLLPGDAQAREIAENALKDKNPEMRSAAAIVLGELHARSSIPRLREILSDNEPSVVLAAASALMTFKDPAAYAVYYEVLTGERKTGAGLIATQMKTLKNPKKMAEMGVEEGIGFFPFAGIGLSAIKALRADDVSPIRAVAAKMLTDDKDPESGQALARATTDKSWIVRAAALEALARRGDPQFLDDVLPAMRDDNTAVRCTAAAAVIRLSTIAAEQRKRP
jgi:HEAT repeat protein